MSANWSDLLVALLHDPPDKALGIRGHEKRACHYLELALGYPISREALHGTDDQLASIIERLPMPHGGDDGLRVGPEDGRVAIVHPLSGQRSELQMADLNEPEVASVISDVVKGIDDPQRRMLVLWRMLPDKLAERHPDYRLLPADTRVPDHTIWHHLETTAGLNAALSGAHGAALLSFVLAPVQSYIEAARSVRDLWTGSMVLSSVSFNALLPVIEAYGPTAVVYPSLRGVPALDRWLRQERQLEHAVPCPETRQLRCPCLPNRFLAVVPWGADGTEAAELARCCEKRARQRWLELSGGVRDLLNDMVCRNDRDNEFADWSKDWDHQVAEFFSFTTSILPLRQCDDSTTARLLGGGDFARVFRDLAAVRRMAEAIPSTMRPRYPQDAAGRWQAQVEVSSRLMRATRAIRHFPSSTPSDRVPPKCSLLGTFEQMGPPGLDESTKFWNFARKHFSVGRSRVRSHERFSAVALTKRFAGKRLLEELTLDADDVRTPDTAEVAAAAWLERARNEGFDLDPVRIWNKHRDWNGQWLFWSRPDEDPDENRIPNAVWTEIQRARGPQGLGAPPAYYAILAMDGDRMGKWLAGELSPTVEEILHPKALQFYRALKDAGVEEALSKRRPLGPARHAAISESLANFALHVVPAIVESHCGTLIYAGGDDVLAMLPISEAITCARELRLGFSGDRQGNGGARDGYYRIAGRDLLMMGSQATASCGLAVVHYKEDLRFALQQARAAETSAKHSGRDVLQLCVCRRSGGHTSALCPWTFSRHVEALVSAFGEGASDRWAYRLRGDLETFQGLDLDAFRAELQRQINRTEGETQRILGDGGLQSAGRRVVESFNDFLSQVTQPPRRLTERQALEHFVILAQSASFLARGGAD